MTTDIVASPYALSPLTVAQSFVDGYAMGKIETFSPADCPHSGDTHESHAWQRGFKLSRAMAISGAWNAS